MAADLKSGARKPRKAAKRKPSGIAAGDLVGVRKAALPSTLSPQLATLVDKCPPGDDWLHEIKYDGYRMMCRVHRGKVTIFSRNGKDWTAALKEIADAVGRLRIDSAWLDGEVTVLTADGRTSFQKLQNALADPAAETLTYFVFDVPFLDGYDLRGVALKERKRLLRTLVPADGSTVRYGVESQGSGGQFIAQACQLGLEGALSKRVDSVYQSGVRTRDWVKVKCGKRQEMVIGGFTDPQGSRIGFGALLLGVYEADGTLRYSGRVGTGFDDATLKRMRRTFDKLTVPTPPFTNPPRGYAAKGAHWMKPKLVAEIAFAEWTQNGTLRHPSFLGLRKDKKAGEVMREKPVKVPARTGKLALPAATKAPVRGELVG